MSITQSAAERRPDRLSDGPSIAELLPRCHSGDSRAINRLLGLPSHQQIEILEQRWRVEWVSDHGASTTEETFGFRIGAHFGIMSVDNPSTKTLLGERRFDLLPRDVRYLLLAGALQPLVTWVENSSRLHFEWVTTDSPASSTSEPTDPHAVSQQVSFVLTEAHKGTRITGAVRFQDAGAWNKLIPASLARRSRPLEEFDGLRLPLGFHIGSTPIQLREVRTIRSGDIISIEQWKSHGAAIVVTADVGGPRGLRLTALAEGKHISVQQSTGIHMQAELPAPAEGVDLGLNLPLDRLDALEVTLRFEVGDFTLSLGELRGIRAGHVFELGQPLDRSAVRILVHGNVLGRGHLVAVGDRLGVRVAEFAPGEAATPRG